MSYEDDFLAKTNEIIEAVKTNKKFLHKTQFSTYALLWSDVVADVCDDIDESLHTLFFDNSSADVFLLVEKHLKSHAEEMAELILKG